MSVQNYDPLGIGEVERQVVALATENLCFGACIHALERAWDAYLRERHGAGRTTREQLIDRHAATVAALEERVAELEAPIDGLLGWFAQHARLCGAQEWIDRLNALAPTEEGGRDA